MREVQHKFSFLFSAFIIVVLVGVIGCAVEAPQTTTNEGTSGNNTPPPVNYVTISGYILGAYTPEWKVFAYEFLNPNAKSFANINTNNGYYSLQVVSNSKIIIIQAFKDNNNNNQIDSGEYVISAETLEVVIADITNLNITVPLLSSNTITVTVSNNVFGLRLGIAIIEDTGYGPGNVLGISSIFTPQDSFSNTITYYAPSGAKLIVGVFEDKNSDNTLNSKTIAILNIPIEPVFPVDDFTNDASKPSSINVTLIPHLITGNVSGDFDGMDRVVFGTPILEFTIIDFGSGSVSGGKYEVKTYSVLKYSTNNTFEWGLILAKDENNDGILDRINDTKYVFSSVSNIDFSIPNTNTNNFDIVKVAVNVSLFGSNFGGYYYEPEAWEISSFKCLDSQRYFLQEVGIYAPGSLPLNKTWYLNRYDSLDESITIFRDYDGDGIFDRRAYDYEQSLFFHLFITNISSTVYTNIQIPISKRFMSIRITNQDILNFIASSQNPVLEIAQRVNGNNSAYHLLRLDDSTTNLAYTIYRIAGAPTNAELTVGEDTNLDGILEDSEKPSGFPRTNVNLDYNGYIEVEL